jgi:hypothetical protein
VEVAAAQVKEPLVALVVLVGAVLVVAGMQMEHLELLIQVVAVVAQVILLAIQAALAVAVS